jgi:hypothetical protein
MFDALLDQLEMDLRAALGTCVTGLVATARARLESAHADVATERAQGLAEVAEERAKALAEVDARRVDLGREVAAMHTHREAQEGHVELNIGGYRFETSVQTLRRVPHTFFDAYFSGRYAQDICDDGSIFVDRDGEHFGHVLEYMRNGVVSVAEAGAQPSVSLLRALKREFGFYSIELSEEKLAEPEQPELAFVIGGFYGGGALSHMERYDPTTDEWSVAAALATPRLSFGTCVVAGEIYVTGGHDGRTSLSSVEKYSPVSDTWSAVVPLPNLCADHAAISVDAAIYVLGGEVGGDEDDVISASASVLKLKISESTWTKVAPMPEARSLFAACVVGSDIYVFGGMDEENCVRASVFKYDTKANAWDVLPPMPTARYGHSASAINGQIYIIGAGDDHRQLLRLEPATGIWSTLASTMHSRANAASFVLGGCLYAAGGVSRQSTMERYDAANNMWTAVVSMLEYRNYYGAVTVGPIGNAEEQDLFDSLITKAIREGQ